MDDCKRAALSRLGLDSALKSLEKSVALADALLETAAAAGIDATKPSPTIGPLLLAVVTGLGAAPEKAARRAFVAQYIADGRLGSDKQATAAAAFFKARPADAAFSPPEFEEACGAGVHITEAQMTERAAEVVAEHAAVLVEQRYAFPILDLFKVVKGGRFAWADGGKLKAAFDAAILALLGPRTAEDDKRVAEALAAKKAAGGKAGAAAAGAGAATGKVGGSSKSTAVTAAASVSSGAAATASVPAATGGAEQAAEESVFVARELASAVNSPALLAEHRKVRRLRAAPRPRAAVLSFPCSPPSRPAPPRCAPPLPRR